MDILALFNSGPATLVTAVVALVVLQKTGVLRVLLAYLTNSERQPPNAEAEPLLSEILASTNRLSEYYNHDTTPILTDIRDELRELTRIHQNYEIIGIKTRECDTKKT